MPSWRLSIYTETKLKEVLRNKNRSATNVPASFSAWFLKKKYLVYYIKWPNFIVSSHLLREILANIVMFVDQSMFLIIPVFLNYQKVR